MQKYSSTTLTIDLAAIVQNYQIVQAQATAAQTAAVVKANAYGLGVDQVAPVLHAAGCNNFFVASLDEAIDLRNIVKDTNIFVFNGIALGQEGVFFEYQISPVLNSMHQIQLWSQHAEKRQENLPCILHVDTGMNRLGLSKKEVDSLLDGDLLNRLDIKMVISHLACADTQSDKNKQQLDAVREIKDYFPNIPISLSNSYGVYLGSSYHFDILRPGIALYGGNPIPGQDNPMQGVIKLTSKIIQIHEIDTPQTVGYGATIELPAGAKIATLPVGYADGYFRSLGNKGHCAIGGMQVPVVGRVSMDLITIDITSIKDEIMVGHEVEIIGDTIKIDDLANWAGTISYEILTNLGARYKRIYTK